MRNLTATDQCALAMVKFLPASRISSAYLSRAVQSFMTGGQFKHSGSVAWGCIVRADKLTKSRKVPTFSFTLLLLFL